MSWLLWPSKFSASHTWKQPRSLSKLHEQKHLSLIQEQNCRFTGPRNFVGCFKIKQTFKKQKLGSNLCFRFGWFQLSHIYDSSKTLFSECLFTGYQNYIPQTSLCSICHILLRFPEHVLLKDKNKKVFSLLQSKSSDHIRLNCRKKSLERIQETWYPKLVFVTASENVGRKICVQNKTRFLCVNQKRIMFYEFIASNLCPLGLDSALSICEYRFLCNNFGAFVFHYPYY